MTLHAYQIARFYFDSGLSLLVLAILGWVYHRTRLRAVLTYLIWSAWEIVFPSALATLTVNLPALRPTGTPGHLTPRPEVFLIDTLNHVLGVGLMVWMLITLALKAFPSAPARAKPSGGALLVVGLLLLWALPGVQAGAATLMDLGDVKPIAINNKSEILVVMRETDELAIWKHWKLTRTGLAGSRSGRNLNDAGHILLAAPRKDDKTRLFIWDGRSQQEVMPPVGKFGSGNWLDNREQVLISDLRGIGIIRKGRLRRVVAAKPDTAPSANAMNDQQQIVGVMVRPYVKGKSRFLARPFAWQQGEFTYLKAPGRGFFGRMRSTIGAKSLASSARRILG